MVNAIAEETLPPQTVFNHSRVALVVRPAKLVYVASQQIEGVLEISCSSDKVWLGRIALELRGQERKSRPLCFQVHNLLTASSSSRALTSLGHHHTSARYRAAVARPCCITSLLTGRSHLPGQQPPSQQRCRRYSSLQVRVLACPSWHVPLPLLLPLARRRTFSLSFRKQCFRIVQSARDSASLVSK